MARPRARRYFLVRRLPPCQSSWTPTWPGSTPKLRSCGRSRRLRLSSAKPGKLARPSTLSHSGPASVLAGQAADHRAEERHASGRLELDDRRPDILAGQRERFVGLAPYHRVERGVVQRIGQLSRQTGLGQDRLQKGPRAAIAVLGLIGVRGMSKIRAPIAA